MSKTIWKFPLERTDYPGVDIPEDFDVLSVALQGGKITLWALVDPKAKTTHRTFRIVGTGHPFADAEQWTHIGTVIEGPFVWHIFE